MSRRTTMSETELLLFASLLYENRISQKEIPIQFGFGAAALSLQKRGYAFRSNPTHIGLTKLGEEFGTHLLKVLK